jgi:GT2 family glycosyltransferase
MPQHVPEVPQTADPPACPTVSVVVLNYNGRDHLDACLGSLGDLDYPIDRLELILVDNASSDDSVTHVARAFPRVRIVETGANLGFAAGNNRGAEAASGDYVVFLNNDTRVDCRFLRGLLRAIDKRTDVVCAGAKILNWDGTAFDFAGSAAHFGGFGYQVGYEQPVVADAFTKQAPILFACGGAMMIDRRIFLEVGAFDEDFFMCYEDVDLGWRLWVLGYQVAFAPEALVYHRHHGSLARLPDYRRQVLYKRNALYAVLKNYEERHVGHVLSAVMLGSLDGLVRHLAGRGQLPLSEYEITSPALPSEGPKLSRDEATALVAAHDVVEHLPGIVRKRREIQSQRRRTDEEVARLFRWPFRYWPGVSSDVQYRVADAFDVLKIFEDVPRRVLVISSDILPFPGLPTVGSGLRAWGLGQGLRSRGHEVLFSMPKAALAGRERFVPPECAALSWETFSMEAVVHQAAPDVVVVCNWPLLALLPAGRMSVPIVLDQHGPHLLERQFQGVGTDAENTLHKLDALSKADFFTCAGDKQLEYFRPWLERAGWTKQEQEEFVRAMPVSLAPELPEREPSGELIFVYGGVFLPWQDPTPTLTMLVETLDERGRGTLHFFGGRHPVYPVNPGMFEELSLHIQKSPRVVLGGVVSHDQLIDQYRRSNVAVDVMQNNDERKLAFTTRTVEYLWCGLPVIYHDYAELSDLIREYDAGWTVNPQDRQAIAAVFEEIFEHPERVAAKSRNAQRLVRERLTWDKTIGPLDDFVRRPRMRRQRQVSSVTPLVGGQTARDLVKAAIRVYRRQGGRAVWRKGYRFLRHHLRG